MGKKTTAAMEQNYRKRKVATLIATEKLEMHGHQFQRSKLVKLGQLD